MSGTPRRLGHGLPPNGSALTYTLRALWGGSFPGAAPCSKLHWAGRGFKKAAERKLPRSRSAARTPLAPAAALCRSQLASRALPPRPRAPLYLLAEGFTADRKGGLRATAASQCPQRGWQLPRCLGSPEGTGSIPGPQRITWHPLRSGKPIDALGGEGKEGDKASKAAEHRSGRSHSMARDLRPSDKRRLCASHASRLLAAQKGWVWPPVLLPTWSQCQTAVEHSLCFPYCRYELTPCLKHEAWAPDCHKSVLWSVWWAGPHVEVVWTMVVVFHLYCKGEWPGLLLS